MRHEGSSWQRRCLLFAALGCVVSLSACSSSKGGSGTTTTSTPSGPTYNGTATVGENTLAFTSTSGGYGGGSCSAGAKSGNGTAGPGLWQLPSYGGSNQNPQAEINAMIQSYKGPGTYTGSQYVVDVSAMSTAPTNGLPNSALPDTNWLPSSSSVLSITVNADGSGSASFTNLQTSGQAPVRASETWTCTS